ncbi:phage pre-tape measure protein (plasmid) [Halobacteriovorax sp. GFR7]|uniref:phage pre-tape measure protein n=1 Tax=unclassified Halobacteriovorax TaxID=2639665 RepID=UPI003D962CD2
MDDKLNIVDLAALELPQETVKLNNNQALVVMGIPYNQLLTAFKDNLHYLDLALQGDANAVTQLLEDQPRKVAYLIACGCGNDSKEAVEKALKMPTQYQAQILATIFKLTFPDGEMLGKFMAELEILLKTVVTGAVQHKVMMHLTGSGIKLPRP